MTFGLPFEDARLNVRYMSAVRLAVREFLSALPSGKDLRLDFGLAVYTVGPDDTVTLSLNGMTAAFYKDPLVAVEISYRIMAKIWAAREHYSVRAIRHTMARELGLIETPEQEIWAIDPLLLLAWRAHRKKAEKSRVREALRSLNPLSPWLPLR